MAGIEKVIFMNMCMVYDDKGNVLACPIGQQYVPEIKMKELPQIILETVASLNKMNKKQERLIEITADGIIDDDELDDFIYIHGVMKYAKEFGIGD